MTRNPRRQRSIRTPEPEVLVYATLTRRAWLRRAIRLTGDVDVLIEYDARPTAWGIPEFIVRLDGGEVTRVSRSFPSPGLEIGTMALPLGRHQVLLTLPARRGPVTAVLTAEVTNRGLLAQLNHLQVRLGNETVYHEEAGEIRTREPAICPIPASQPLEEVTEIPIPSRAEER